jgi:hypothetical protein
MTQYAADTSVSSEKSRNEIESILRRYGADEFAYATNKERAMIGFVANDRQVRLILPMPDPKARQFTHTPGRGYARSAAEADKAYEQAIRQKWRALALMVKAKLEAVESGIVSFEQEFLPHIILPGGLSVYETIQPGIEQSYLSGKVAPLLALGAHS